VLLICTPDRFEVGEELGTNPPVVWILPRQGKTRLTGAFGPIPAGKLGDSE
jgi:hypothetical protein